jgi:hypothetical protein
LGTVGLDWELGGFAVDPPADNSGEVSLVQAIAGMGAGSGAADSVNTIPLSADTSQQTFLTTPQHALAENNAACGFHRCAMAYAAAKLPQPQNDTWSYSKSLYSL